MATESAQRILAIHRRLVARDPTASAELVEAMLESLKGYLVKRHLSALDRETLHDIAVDALMSYVIAPDRFDPSRSGLFHYLTLIADGDVRDTIRKESRRPRKLEPFVEDRQPATNISIGGGPRSDMHKLETRLDAIAILDRFQPEICSDPGDENVLALILHGERDVSAFAHALGLDDPEGEEARRTVLRAKDKIKRRLRRLGDRLQHG